MRAVLSALVLLGWLAGAVPVDESAIGARARVIDGDTLDVDGVRMRLFGVDAPEAAQTCSRADGAEWPCGAAAAARLEALVEAPPLRCTPRDRDRYGRVVASCAAGGVDVGGRLVAEGLAWAYTRYSTLYAETEAAARAAGRGVWQGPAQVAWEWRRRGEDWRAASGQAAPDQAPPEGCAIKGNINAEGERIYHTPDSPWYDRVRVNQARGQRWFCDEAEARAAGWRPPAGR